MAELRTLDTTIMTDRQASAVTNQRARGLDMRCSWAGNSTTLLMLMLMHRDRLFLLAIVGTLTLGGCAHEPVAPLIPYQCDSGAQLAVRYPAPDTAILHFPPRVYELTIARSADGARYTNHQLQWWTQGTGPGASATLFTRGADGGPGEIAERCVEIERDD